MNIMGIQILLFFFSFIMIYTLFLHWKRKEVSNFTFGIWLFVWMFFVLVALFPDILKPLVVGMKFTRVMDFGMIGAFIILTYLTFENNFKIKKNEKNLEKIIRKLAIKKTRKHE